LKAGDSNQTVQVGTLGRTYVLHVPTGYVGTKPLPVVIDFHPLGGTGSQWEGSSGWKAKADSVGFIIAYPNSYNSNNSWNVGFCCQDAQKNQIDDVAFTKAMIQQIETLACVDPKRIYATGCSNGGGMTYKAACDLADMIAGAAPVDFRCVYGGSTGSPSCEGCKPARPISITHFDNTGDTQLVPYAGGVTSFAADCPPNMSCTGMAFPSAQDNFKKFQDIDQCSGSTSALTGHAACQTNASCRGGVQVSMCVQQGGSHCGNYASLGIVDILVGDVSKASAALIVAAISRWQRTSPGVQLGVTAPPAPASFDAPALSSMFTAPPAAASDSAAACMAAADDAARGFAIRSARLAARSKVTPAREAVRAGSGPRATAVRTGEKNFATFSAQSHSAQTIQCRSRVLI
jgi:polyhydroxybutyrate depolymerase